MWLILKLIIFIVIFSYLVSGLYLFYYICLHKAPLGLFGCPDGHQNDKQYYDTADGTADENGNC